MAKRNKKPQNFRPPTSFWESAHLNRQTFDYYYFHLMELATACFHWKNLPDTIDPRFLEMCLFYKGMCVFFKDPVIGYLALQLLPGGTWNVYDIPTKRIAYGSNGYRMNLTAENSVIIFNNYSRMGTAPAIEMYANRLSNIARTIDVNVLAQKTPKILACSENQRLTLQNLYKEYMGNEPFIFGDKHLEVTPITSLDTSTPFVSDKLQMIKRQMYNEALTYLGIENNNSEKAERLVTNEGISNVSPVQAARFTRLNPRQEACEQINRMFGLNISCEYRAPLSIDRMMQEVQNGQVYNGAPDDMRASGGAQ